MAIIVSEGCHVGLLGSLDSMDEALSRFPLPENVSRGERDVERLAYGICGRLFTFSPGRGLVSIRTDPNEANLVIMTEGLTLEEGDKAKIRRFLDEFFGAADTHIN